MSIVVNFFSRLSYVVNFFQTSVQIDDNFLAAYQASYGVPQPETTPTDPTHSTPVIPTPIQTQSTTDPPGQLITTEDKVSFSSMAGSPLLLVLVQYST